MHVTRDGLKCSHVIHTMTTQPSHVKDACLWMDIIFLNGILRSACLINGASYVVSSLLPFVLRLLEEHCQRMASCSTSSVCSATIGVPAGVRHGYEQDAVASCLSIF